MSLTLTYDEYRALVEAAPVMVWRSGTDARCDYFNETWLAFTGRTLEEEAGDGWAEGVHSDDLDRCVAEYLSHFHRRESFEIEYRLRRRDGVYRWIFDRGAPFQVGGEFGGFIGSCVDVQERRDAEADRRTTLSMVAHELRTPLTAVQTYLDVIQAKTGADAAVFDKVARQIQRFSRLIDDLSDTARIEGAQALGMIKSELDLAEVVRRVAATYEELAPRRNPRVRFEAHADAPACRVHGDPDRLEQVLVNILENAFKFSPGGLVSLSCFLEGEAACVRIADQGIGIHPDEIAKVTRPYFRASNAPAHRFPGAGMGLAIASELVAQHGGQLAIASELGTGTAVTVRLPRSA
ncbi:MAG TPA: PAS domain-containing sensor histidine kinase [Kofleriaceae bacterium]|nr:PAS domain-containing sensor histidine kinase [Kofleriaceae bacterium]